MDGPSADALNKEAAHLVEETTHPDAKVYTFDDQLSPEEKKNKVVEASSAPPPPPSLDLDNDASLASSGAVPGAFSVRNDTRCGWTDFSTLPNPGQDHLIAALKKSLTDEQIATIYAGSRLDDYIPDDGLLAQFLGDAYYGKWFHNAGALTLAVVLTFILTKLGAGLFACLTVGAFLGKAAFENAFD